MVKVNRTLSRNVVICVFAIVLCTGLVFPTNDAYARVSLSDLQADIEALQNQNDDQQDQIEALEAQNDQLLDRVRLLEIGDVARFTDMGNGTIRDNNTGLIWLKDASCSDLPGADSNGMANWDNATAAAAALGAGICGLTDGSAPTDWRLPTKEEWEAFYTPYQSPGAYTNPALVNTEGDAQWSEGDAFTGVKPSLYWSSTEYDSRSAWYASMFYGYMDYILYGSKGNDLYVWPVRSGN